MNRPAGVHLKLRCGFYLAGEGVSRKGFQCSLPLSSLRIDQNGIQLRCIIPLFKLEFADIIVMKHFVRLYSDCVLIQHSQSGVPSTVFLTGIEYRKVFSFCEGLGVTCDDSEDGFGFVPGLDYRHPLDPDYRRGR